MLKRRLGAPLLSQGPPQDGHESDRSYVAPIRERELARCLSARLSLGHLQRSHRPCYRATHFATAPHMSP